MRSCPRPTSRPGRRRTRRPACCRCRRRRPRAYRPRTAANLFRCRRSGLPQPRRAVAHDARFACACCSSRSGTSRRGSRRTQATSFRRPGPAPASGTSTSPRECPRRGATWRPDTPSRERPIARPGCPRRHVCFPGPARRATHHTGAACVPRSLPARRSRRAVHAAAMLGVLASCRR